MCKQIMYMTNLYTSHQPTFQAKCSMIWLWYAPNVIIVLCPSPARCCHCPDIRHPCELRTVVGCCYSDQLPSSTLHCTALHLTRDVGRHHQPPDMWVECLNLDIDTFGSPLLTTRVHYTEQTFLSHH